MRRWLSLVLLLLTVATTADARGLVIYPIRASNTNNDQRGLSNYIRWARGVFDSFGMDYEMVPADGISTPNAATGQWTQSNGTVVTADYLIVLDFSVNSTDFPTINTASSSTFYPNWLTRQTRYWPTIPTLMVGTWRIPASGIWTSVDSCSTMVTGALNPYSSTIASGWHRSVYATGRSAAWKSYNGLHPLALAATTADKRVEPLVQSHMSGATWGTINTCTDCDSMGRALADSSLMWQLTKKRTDGSGDTTGVPVTYVWPTANSGGGGSDFSSALLAMGVAKLHSNVKAADASNRVLLERPLSQPLKWSVLISGAGRHNAGIPGATTDVAGGMNRADSSVAYRSCDSLGTLDVPMDFTFPVDPDTNAAYPNELANITSRIRDVKFLPVISRGWSGSNVGASGATTFATPIDTWGRSRQVAIGYPGLDCTTDTTLYCRLAALMARGRTVFGSRLCYAVRAPGWDILASQYSRGRLPNQDSLNTVLAANNIRTVVLNPGMAEGTPGATYYVTSSSGAALGLGTAPNLVAPFKHSQRMPAYDPVTRVRRADVFYAATRSEAFGEAQTLNLAGTGHSYVDEFIWGSLGRGSVWFPLDYPFYLHDFRTPLQIFELPFGLLHGQSQAERRFAWWQVKWAVNQTKTVNYFAGESVWRIVHVDEL